MAMANLSIRLRASAQPVAWRVRGYAQFKTGKPGPWRYVDGPDRPAVNNPECCDFEPLYTHEQGALEAQQWGEVRVTLEQVEELAKTMWKGEPVPGRVLRFGAAVLGLSDAATAGVKEASRG